MHTARRIAGLAAQLAANRAFLLSWDRGQAADSERGLVMYRSEVQYAPLNGVLRINDCDIDRALTDARQNFAGLPWVWWVGPDSAPETADELLRRGAAELERLPVLVMDASLAASVQAPAGIAIDRVRGPAELTEFVLAHSFAASLRAPDVRLMVAHEAALLRAERVDLFAARAGGRIVGTSMAWVSHGVTGIYLVGTHPDFRGSGIGTALTAAAVRAGEARGGQVAALTASAMGEPVYRRMGFSEVTQYRLLSVPTWSEPN
ncbi:GNAT family N-acetyltransferase [Kribbella albertanoniae]|nr:GNAT family N-acetyltransferase [Kribbella albertanoniae]